MAFYVPISWAFFLKDNVTEYPFKNLTDSALRYLTKQDRQEIIDNCFKRYIKDIWKLNSQMQAQGCIAFGNLTSYIGCRHIIQGVLNLGKTTQYARDLECIDDEVLKATLEKKETLGAVLNEVFALYEPTISAEFNPKCREEFISDFKKWLFDLIKQDVMAHQSGV